MLTKLAYTQVAGMSLLALLGIFMFLVMVASILFAYLYRKRKLLPHSYKWHIYLGIVTLVIGLIHGILGMAKYF